MDILQAAPTLPVTNGRDIVRRSANYHPSVWGDYFLAYASDLTQIDPRGAEEHEQLRKDLTKMLLATPNTSLEKLKQIDAMQRLGVSYHFESHVNLALHCIYNDYEKCIKEDDDLSIVALRFRLLRQQGYPVSCDIFNKFMDQEGNFDKSLLSDTEGILSLFEAAHYRVHGEDILEKVLTFTTTQLESMLPNSSSPYAAQIFQALKLPIHISLTRLGAKEYIPIYEKDASRHELLLKFSKLDFNILQNMHQRELSDVTMWWKSLEFTRKQPFARDRLVECYFWAWGVYFEPQYCLGRRTLTKVIAMISIIDDIYDVYGKFDELELFTDAITRWDTTATNKLPAYMQNCYGALLDVFSEIEKELTKEGKLRFVHFAKEEMKKLVRAYFAEANWCHNNYTPTFEEYMKIALASATYMMLATTSFLFMGDIVTNEAFDWVTNEPLMVKASSVIGRLLNDIVGHEFEQERGQAASAVECYMKQHGTSKKDAYTIFQKQVTNAWKDLNAEYLRPTAVPMPFLDRIFNLARVSDLIYKDEDRYTNSKTKLRNFISSVLVDPVII